MPQALQGQPSQGQPLRLLREALQGQPLQAQLLREALTLQGRRPKAIRHQSGQSKPLAIRGQDKPL